MGVSSPGAPVSRFGSRLLVVFAGGEQCAGGLGGSGGAACATKGEGGGVKKRHGCAVLAVTRLSAVAVCFPGSGGVLVFAGGEQRAGGGGGGYFLAFCYPGCF